MRVPIDANNTDWSCQIKQTPTPRRAEEQTSAKDRFPDDSALLGYAEYNAIGRIGLICGSGIKISHGKLSRRMFLKDPQSRTGNGITLG